MQGKKYSLASAVYFCFQYAPAASFIKLLIEIINGVLMPLMVLVVAAFINGAVAFVSGDGELAPIIIMILLMAGYYAYSQANQILIRIADKALENALREKLRAQIIQKHARTSFASLENPETLDLTSRVSEGTEGQMMVIYRSSINIVRIAIQAFGMALLLVTHIWWIIPLFVMSTVPILLIARRGGLKIYDMFRISTKLTRKHYYLSDVLVGRETAAERTLFGYADHINSQFSATHLERSNLVTKALIIEESAINACELILNAVVIVAAFALLSALSENTMSHGLYVSLVGALIGLSKMITGVLAPLVRDSVEYAEYMRDFTRYFALPEIDDDSQMSDNDPLHFEYLEIRNLRFRYTPDSPYVLDGVNFVIESGKQYSLIGQNGAGKSTLSKILLGLYRDFEGEILINGVDIAEYTTDELRRIFSIVYQDFAKYYIPLENNVTLGQEQGDMDAALRLAELEDVVAKLPQKENTPLGKIYDGGVDVSGGEWQKIAIARALYANTSFMILDEPTASLSPMMESKLYRRFAELTKDKTSLLISHRLGSTKLSDVLFVLDNGAIAETGTHDKLMTAGSIYAEMFNSQRSWYDEN
ncbi:MAG: ABC transporter ATP-binding protein/permease [Defluviitaleaceae bacterium]|nr:ABC transporter ATP-binding protein/permease [Defluviitaleaceae bacterium]